MERTIRETTDIEPHPDNMNSKESFFLSKSWKPLWHTLKERKKCPSSKKS
jgi:hypothetical protein